VEGIYHPLFNGGKVSEALGERISTVKIISHPFSFRRRKVPESPREGIPVEIVHIIPLLMNGDSLIRRALMDGDPLVKRDLGSPTLVHNVALMKRDHATGSAFVQDVSAGSSARCYVKRSARSRRKFRELVVAAALSVAPSEVGGQDGSKDEASSFVLVFSQILDRGCRGGS